LRISQCGRRTRELVPAAAQISDWNGSRSRHEENISYRLGHLHCVDLQLRVNAAIAGEITGNGK
jgi:hypothetical protein